MLLFGREPQVPIDVAFGVIRNDSKDKIYSDYIADLQNKIKDVFDIVNRNANKSRDKQKAYYDLKAKAAKLLEGDRVLIKILAHEGKQTRGQMIYTWLQANRMLTYQYISLERKTVQVQRRHSTGIICCILT